MTSLGRTVVALASLTSLVACKQDGLKQPCMSMAGQGALVAQAKSFEVVVYAGTVDCAAPTGKPEKDQRYAAGDTIELDVKSGPHTIVLWAYSDAAGTNAIGRACQQGDFGKGSQLCFDVTVQPVYDLGVIVDQAVPDATEHDQSVVDVAPAIDLLPSPDLMPRECFVDNDCLVVPGRPRCTQAGTCVECLFQSDCAGGDCCSNVCSSLKTLSNCGGCGVTCGGATPHGSPSCDTGACVLNCDKGYESCDTDTSNGCETHLTDDPNHCGACTRACKKDSSVNVPSCKGGKCDSSCVTPAGNCQQPDAPTADDGCETPLNTTTNCLTCGGACQGDDAENMAGTCGAGGCQYVCKDAHADCDTSPAKGGCECATASATIPDNTVESIESMGTKGCCNTGCQTKHDSGVAPGTGKPTVPYFDCQPTGNNVTTAMHACAVWSDGCTASVCPTDNTSSRVCGLYRADTSYCICWEFASTMNPGLVGRVHVTHNPPGGVCDCPDSNNSTWN